MKHIITFLIAGLLIAPLAGQNLTNKSGGSKTRIQTNSTGQFNMPGMENRHDILRWIANRKNSSDLLRSTAENKHKLDSTISEEYIESTGQWTIQLKEENNYYENGKLKDQNSLTWVENNGSGRWNSEYKYEFVYDSKGNMTQHIFNEWDLSAELWSVNWEIEFSYDNNGNLMQWLFSSWDEDSSKWNGVSKIEYNYNENNKRILETEYWWSDVSGQWVNINKYEYSYDSTGNITLDMKYDWDEEQWTEDYKNEYIYDDEGILTMIISGNKWETGEWINEYKNEFAFNVDGNLILRTNYEWENQWIKDSKEEYIFANNGNLEEEIYFNWDKNKDAWVESSKTGYTYDDSFTYNDLILPVMFSMYYYYSGTYWWEKYYNHMQIANIRSDRVNNNSEWLEKYRTTNYYSETEVTGITETADFNLVIYPNPVTDEFGVRSSEFRDNEATVKLYDLNGRKLLEKQIPAGSKEITVDVRGLQSGLYFCRISMEKGSVTKKLIIQK